MKNKIKNRNIPKRLQPVLWSYNINKLDAERDKELIITQILNYGVWEDLRWLYKTYPEREIKKVVRRPRGGFWHKDVLNFWSTLLNIHIPKNIYQKAIFNVHPKFH